MRSRILNIKADSKLFFGDPCYVLTNEDYQSAVVDNPDVTNKVLPEGVEGRDVEDNVITVFCDTKYGDGDYPSKSGKQFGVDSGTLGVSLITDVKYEIDVLNNLGQVVNIPKNTTYIDVFAERKPDSDEGDVVLAAIFFDENGKRIASVDTVIYTDDGKDDSWDFEDDYDDEDYEDE